MTEESFFNSSGIEVHGTAPGARAALKPTEPCVLVIFGGSGDLTKRKLVPALYNLDLDGALPAELRIVGVARTPISDDDFRRSLREATAQHSRRPLDGAVWSRFERRLSYV